MPELPPAVMIPTPETHSPARRALEMEGIDPLEVWCTEPCTYGEYFSTFWARGLPFVVVEWDVIPWPGAVDKLLACPEPRCVHRYPLHQGNVALGFGIGKYVPVGPAPSEWAETEWRMLDGAVVPVLNQRLGMPHVHEPPVAHARAELAA